MILVSFNLLNTKKVYTAFLATAKLNAREALKANEEALESLLRRFEDLSTILDRQRRAWERFDVDAKQLDADLTVAQVEKKPAPGDARQRLGECAALADKVVRLSGSAAAKSALGERLAALNTKINNLQSVSFFNKIHFHNQSPFKNNNLFLTAIIYFPLPAKNINHIL